MKISKDLNINLNNIKKSNNNSTDISSRIININNKKIGYIFLESVSSDDKISDFLVKSLTTNIKNNLFHNIFESLKNNIQNSKLSIINNLDDIFFYLSSGFTCILVEGYELGIIIETKSNLDRGINESTSESIIRGPKDSFTENFMINIGLIRKRIKDNNLIFDEVKIGRRTKTKIAVSYIKDIANKKYINDIMKKLKKIDIDSILDSGNLRDFLSINNSSVFPKMISTERPDATCNALLEGKIVIIVENSPFALIIPGLLIDIFHSPEDYYQIPLNVTITRLLRFIGFLITILLPAFYIAFTTFNFEIIPDNLLIQLAIQRSKVPFPTSVEIIILLITFEILRETDIRIPNKIGSSVSIVGALVLGDAAVQAGIVSPIAVIVVAITSVCGLLFSDIDVINGIRFWRGFFIIFSAFMGFVGLSVSIILFIIKLSSMEELGISYLSPTSPFNLEDQKDSLIKFPRSMINKRPNYLKTKNKNKGGHYE